MRQKERKTTEKETGHQSRTSRFASLSEGEMQQILTERHPGKIKRKTNWSVSTFKGTRKFFRFDIINLSLRWLYKVFWRARHGYENGALARSLKLVLIATNKTKWLPAILQNLCLVFLYVISHEELYSKMCRQNCFLCVDSMKKYRLPQNC